MSKPALPTLSLPKAALNMVTKMMINRLSKENLVAFVAHRGWVKTYFGGKNAPVEPVDSITGMINVLYHFESEDNATFIDLRGNKLKK